MNDKWHESAKRIKGAMISDERLKTGMAHIANCMEIAELRGEIESLQTRLGGFAEALGMLTTLKPDLEMDINHPVEMASAIVGYVNEMRNALEKIRGNSLDYHRVSDIAYVALEKK